MRICAIIVSASLLMTALPPSANAGQANTPTFLEWPHTTLVVAGD
jgi:hypothetical protein